MGKKAKVKIRHRIVVKSTVQEFVLLGDFLRSFNGTLFGEMIFGSQCSRKGDLVVEVIPEVDNRKQERLPGWFRVGPHRAQVVLKGATQDQLGKFAEAIRKEWFPTKEELRDRESARKRMILDRMLLPLEADILRFRRSMEMSKFNVDHAPLKTD